MTVMRGPDWNVRLFEYIEGHRCTRFQWGTLDCCTFVAGCVQAMTGIDYAAPLRGYTTEAQAYAILSRYDSMRAMVTALLGSGPVDVSMARRGDVLLAIQGDGSESLRICLGKLSAMPGARGIGLAFPPAGDAQIAWKV